MKKLCLCFLLIILIVVTGCTNVKEDGYVKVVDNIKEVKTIINDREYILNLEDNETTKDFLNMLPIDLDMSELNGNEKYINLDKNLKTNPYNPKRINAGDVMLFGDNCLVIFYKSFDTTYSYTKIGHIDNLNDLGNGDIKVRFEKLEEF